jgi:hypothetical protein
MHLSVIVKIIGISEVDLFGYVANCLVPRTLVEQSMLFPL